MSAPFREELHPRDRRGRWSDLEVRVSRSSNEDRRRARIERIKDAMPSLDAIQRTRLAVIGMPHPPLRGPTPAQTKTELTLAKTFGFTRPLGKDANGNYLVAAGGQRHSIDGAGKIVMSARIRTTAGQASPGHTLASPRPARRGTVDTSRHLPQHHHPRPSINYIDAPTIPEGMTVAEYRKKRALAGKANTGVDWKARTADIPAFGGEDALARMNDETLRNLLALRGFPAPRKAQVRAEMDRRKSLPGSDKADLLRRYGFRVGKASPGLRDDPAFDMAELEMEDGPARASDRLWDIESAIRSADVRSLEDQGYDSIEHAQRTVAYMRQMLAKPSPGIGALTPRDVEKLLVQGGFERKRQRGSHAVFGKPGGGRNVVLPMHRRSMSRGTLMNVLSTAGLIEAAVEAGWIEPL